MNPPIDNAGPDTKETTTLLDVLKSIIHDATGDIDDEHKRLWPIRAANYRLATEIIAKIEG